MLRPKVVLILNNPNQLGGPTVAMRRIADSSLSDNYEFIEVHITEKLGKVPRLKVIKRVADELKAINPDIVHITGLQLHGFYGVISARFAKIKNILLVVRGSSCDALGISNISKAIFRWLIEPVTIKLSKITYTVCEEMAENPIVKDNVINFGGVIHNPAPTINRSLFNGNRIREEIGLNNDDIVVVYTGRIIEDKGLSYALDAFDEINNSNIKFLLVGKGTDEEFYKEKYRELVEARKVFFMGERSDVFDVLAASDIFLFPTLHENLSNSLLEACTMGLTIIASDVGGNPEVITNNFDGVLIPTRDKSAIIEAVNELAGNYEKRKLYGNRIMNKMEESFSSDVIYAKLDKLYKEVLNPNE